MIPVGNMLWRIGDVLDIDEQITWSEEAGFDGVGFHASKGTPDRWRGVEPADCPPGERQRLRERLRAFRFVEIHAPFAIKLTTDRLDGGLSAFAPVLAFAKDVGANVVTVHAEIPGGSGTDAAWREAMGSLNSSAAEADVRIGLEITEGFSAVVSWGLERVGVTLDVGHMYLPGGRGSLDREGGLRAIINRLGERLAHLHVHDVNGETDHIETGIGEVDFDGMLAGLHDVGYRHAMCLEMNPDRVSPDGMRRSMEFLRTRWADITRA